MQPPILVINPYAADFKLYDEWMHPLGLYFLMTDLKRSGHEVRFFNCLSREQGAKNKKYGTGDFFSREIEKPSIYRSIPRKYKLYGRPQGELRAFLALYPRPECICIGSMMTYWLPGVIDTVRTVREMHRDVPIVLGGIAVRLMPEVVREQMPGVILAGSPEASSFFRPLAKEHSPADSLIGGLEALDNPRHGPILTSLGCPLACTYCASHRLQGRYRLRPMDQVVREIRFCVERLHVRDFAFYDDALLYQSEEGFAPLIRALHNAQLPVRMHAPNGLHLRFIDEYTAGLLKNAGFTTLRFGYESGASHYEDDRNGKIARGDLHAKLRHLFDAGFKGTDIGVYVMAGLPGQKPCEVIEEMEFVSSLGVKAKPVYYSPVPGTPLFERYAALFPQIRSEPLRHNDSFFITQLPGWSFGAVESIRIRAAELNLKVVGS